MVPVCLVYDSLIIPLFRENPCPSNPFAGFYCTGFENLDFKVSL
jgi:hypothetical protein